ncbi:uncharacterized protein [Rutidosis leptorrhynchoides]|uniref:uncharacterized protein n=1 Tax=Rutidosis leptorrhynchoides TaxID=125765 RepID=UPI003A9A15F0
MVLCHGDLASVQLIKKALDDFISVLGLFPNLRKSVVYFGNVSEEVKRIILQLLPFKVGKLRMRYLGLPLLAKSLCVGDCKCLVDKVKAKASVYMILGAVITEIEKVLKGFLWNPGDSSKDKAKVAWKSICIPKIKVEWDLNL